MKSKKLDFEKPQPHNKCKLYRYGNRYDLETQISKKNNRIGIFRKLNRNDVLNTATGEIIRCKHINKKQEKLLFKTFKHLQRIILANHSGKLGELLVILEYENAPKNVYMDLKSFLAKIERRIKQKLEYILVLQYNCMELPQYEMWTSINVDEISIDTLQDIVRECWTLGKITIIQLNPDNIVELSSYYIPKRNNATRLDSFPAYAKVFRTSKGIKRVIPEEMDYEEAEKIVAEYDRVFSSTKALIVNDNRKEKIIGKVSYETYKKDKNQPEINDTS